MSKANKTAELSVRVSFKLDEDTARDLWSAASQKTERNESMLIRSYIRAGLKKDGYLTNKNRDVK